MYTIVGGDGQRYGPVDADQLRQWIAQGRANGQTLTSQDGGDWKPLSTFPEFADLTGGAPGVAAPPGSSPLPAPDASHGAPSVATASNAVEQARSMMQVPGILVALAGGLGTALFAVNILMRLFGAGMAPPGGGTVPPEFEWVFDFMAGGAGAVLDLIRLGLNIAVLIGGLQMLRLQRYSFCIGAAIIAVLPCLSPCCCIGIPGGIWALVILAKPEVRNVFSSG
jgi:hypothetical protein